LLHQRVGVQKAWPITNDSLHRPLRRRLGRFDQERWGVYWAWADSREARTSGRVRAVGVCAERVKPCEIELVFRPHLRDGGGFAWRRRGGGILQTFGLRRRRDRPGGRGARRSVARLVHVLKLGPQRRHGFYGRAIRPVAGWRIHGEGSAVLLRTAADCGTLCPYHARLVAASFMRAPAETGGGAGNGGSCSNRRLNVADAALAGGMRASWPSLQIPTKHLKPGRVVEGPDAGMGAVCGSVLG
jgi:hypothetical protein